MLYYTITTIMVKNFGGNKSKKLARKVVTAPRDTRLRTPNPNEPDEQFACVSKMLGNGMCHVICGDQHPRICIIRNKFRGRSKRDNTISTGSFVLIDIRSWETVSDTKIQKCDLLEVYNKSEMDRLIDTVKFDWTIFKGIGAKDEDKSTIENDNGFEFTDTNTTELEQNIRADTKTAMDQSVPGGEGNETVDIDEI